MHNEISVVMPFDEKANERYNVIKEVCQKLNLKVSRADEIIEEGRTTTEKIKNWIAISDLVIVDVTGANANVMYELGYAHALSKPVILLASNYSELRFDTSNFKVIIIDDSVEGRNILIQSLNQTLEKIEIMRRTEML